MTDLSNISTPIEVLKKAVTPMGLPKPKDLPRKKLDVSMASLRANAEDVFQAIEPNKFNRWTERDKERFLDIAGKYQELAIAAMRGKDVSTLWESLHKEIRTVAREQSFDGVQAIQTAVYRWLGEIFHMLIPGSK